MYKRVALLFTKISETEGFEFPHARFWVGLKKSLRLILPTRLLSYCGTRFERRRRPRIFPKVSQSARVARQ